MRVRSFFPPTVEQNDKFPLFYTPDFNVVGFYPLFL